MLPVQRCTFEFEEGPYAGRAMHLIDEGPAEAPTVVFVHGNPTWSFLWRKVIAALPGFRSVAPDLLGFGLSAQLRSAVDHTIDNHTNTLVAMTNALVPGPFIVVGQDWGGPLAVQLARALPGRVRGIVLANTAVFVPDRPRGTSFHTFARLPLVSDLAFRGLGFPQNMMWAVQGDRRSIRGRVAKAYRWPLRRPADRVGPLALARMVPERPDHPSMAALREGSAWLSDFKGPTGLVWGSRDPILGRALRRHERELPRAELTVTDAGHFLQEEVPEAIAAAIKSVHARAKSWSDRPPT
ncbi:MAG: alpha/beta fold hydrolase [Nannocystaceae bacterium]|nr:alpha/beta fold hydrolase [Nannocystaceae bacterium]